MKSQVSAWHLQRWSAMVLAFCVVVHLATMILAVHSGLTAQAILGRLHGNLTWAAFYAAFLTAAVVHVPIGLKKIAQEWLGWRGASVHLAAGIIVAALAVAGAAAIYGLVWGSM